MNLKRSKAAQTTQSIRWAMGAGVLAVLFAVAIALGGGGLLRAQGQAPAAQGQAPAGGPPAGAPHPPVALPATTHLEVADGTRTNYHAHEQFVGVTFFSDAIGETSAVTGTMTLNPDGTIAPGAKFDIDLRSLKSNEDVRDNIVRTRLLEVDKFPTAEFIPKTITGLPNPIPGTGASGFQLTGDMTIHGVTKPITFNGLTTFSPTLLSGRAVADITFATFDIMKPQIPRLLGVQDNISLELVFHMKRS